MTVVVDPVGKKLGLARERIRNDDEGAKRQKEEKGELIEPLG